MKDREIKREEVEEKRAEYLKNKTEDYEMIFDGFIPSNSGIVPPLFRECLTISEWGGLKIGYWDDGSEVKKNYNDPRGAFWDGIGGHWKLDETIAWKPVDDTHMKLIHRIDGKEEVLIEKGEATEPAPPEKHLDEMTEDERERYEFSRETETERYEREQVIRKTKEDYCVTINGFAFTKDGFAPLEFDSCAAIDHDGDISFVVWDESMVAKKHDPKGAFFDGFMGHWPIDYCRAFKVLDSPDGFPVKIEKITKK